MSRKSSRIARPFVSPIESLESRTLLTAVTFTLQGANTLSIAQSTVVNGTSTSVIFEPNQLTRNFRGTITADVTDDSLTLLGSNIFANIPTGTDYYNFGATINSDVIEHHYTDLLFNLSTPVAVPFTHADGNFDSGAVNAELVTGTLNYDNWSGPASSPVFDSITLDGAGGPLMSITLPAGASLERVGNAERLTIPFQISYEFDLPMYYNSGTDMRQGSQTGPITNFQHTLTFTGTIVATAGFVTGNTGAIRSDVFLDANSNANFDAEEGLGGVQVYLDDNNNNVLDADETFVLTDENGQYVFPWRDPGTYIVRHVVPAGYRLVLPADGRRVVDVVATEIQEDDINGDPAVFGDNTLPGSIAGTVFKDTNYNGIKDGSEVGLFGIRVYLDLNNNGAFNTSEPFTFTNASGTYLLSGVNTGTYTLRHVIGAGLRSTVPPTGAYQVTLVSGQGLVGQDFGDADLPGTISGRVYEDLNDDGIRQTGETPLSGVRVYIDSNGNNSFDNGETNTIADGAGAYMFLDIRPGTYTIRHVVPAGYTLRAPTSGEYSVTVGVAQDIVNRNFGDIFVGSAISGTVFDDLNGNGIFDGGEPGIAGVRVYIDSSGDGRFNSGERFTNTDGGGNFTLSGIKQGRRVVRHDVPAGYRLTRPGDGFYSVKVFNGQVVSGVDFGSTSFAQISGVLFNDANSDGQRSATERWMKGWVVYLDQNRNAVLDPGEVTATSGRGGVYSFNGIEPGTYYIRQEQHAGWRITRPSRNIHTVTISENEVITGRNFGNTDNVYISGNVFFDQNGDGRRAKTELYYTGVTIYDDENNNGRFDRFEVTATTQLDGSWVFTTLTSGVHNIRMVTPARTNQTAPAKKYFSLKIKRGVILQGLLFGIK